MRLNLCCGGQTPVGWENVDRAGAGVTLVDITEEWPWAHRSAEGIVLHHALDLFTNEEASDILRLCLATLELGAVLRISFADLEEGVRRAVIGDASWFAEPQPTLEETLGFFVTQGGARKQVLDVDSLVETLKEVGFCHALTSTFGETCGPQWLRDLDSRPEESVFVEAIR